MFLGSLEVATTIPWSIFDRDKRARSNSIIGIPQIGFMTLFGSLLEPIRA
jgi:hypothetical protein